MLDLWTFSQISACLKNCLWILEVYKHPIERLSSATTWSRYKILQILQMLLNVHKYVTKSSLNP